MGVLTTRWIPNVTKIFDPTKIRVGWNFKTQDNYAEMYMENDQIKFKINTTDILTLSEDGMTDEIGGSFLPDQAGQTGKFLTTDGSDASWDDVVTGVSSVFGRTGAVVAATDDYTWAQVDKTTSDIADITTKSHTSLSDVGSNTHTQIDTHISNTSNPHTVTATQLTSGTLPAARLPASGVTPGSYTYSSITVDTYGRVTAASNGTAPPTTRQAKETLTSGDNGITFSSTLGSTNWIFVGVPYCYDSSGNTVSGTVTNRLATGFTINVPENCTLDYKVQLL